MTPVINLFLVDLDSISRSRLDFVLETDSDFEGFVSEQSFHFPCYNRDCDADFLDCDPETQQLGLILFLN